MVQDGSLHALTHFPVPWQLKEQFLVQPRRRQVAVPVQTILQLFPLQLRVAFPAFARNSQPPPEQSSLDTLDWLDSATQFPLGHARLQLPEPLQGNTQFPPGQVWVLFSLPSQVHTLLARQGGPEHAGVPIITKPSRNRALIAPNLIATCRLILISCSRHKGAVRCRTTVYDRLLVPGLFIKYGSSQSKSM